MTTELYVLYFLRIPKTKAFKIGITSFDRKEKRFKEIERDFGKIDLKKSYYYTSTSMKDIKNFEKAFHLIFWRYAKDLKAGSGYTEFFKDYIFTNVSTLIYSLKKQHKINGPITFINQKSFLLQNLFVSTFLILLYIKIDYIYKFVELLLSQ